MQMNRCQQTNTHEQDDDNEPVCPMQSTGPKNASRSLGALN